MSEVLFTPFFVLYVYVALFGYHKILIRCKLEEDGIGIYFLNFRQNFIKFNEVLFVSINNQKINIVSSNTSFPDPRTVLPISKIYITTNRKVKFAFTEKFQGYVIYPRDTLNFYREIKQKMNLPNQTEI
jgi:hypothetical protein